MVVVADVCVPRWALASQRPGRTCLVPIATCFRRLLGHLSTRAAPEDAPEDDVYDYIEKICDVPRLEDLGMA